MKLIQNEMQILLLLILFISVSNFQAQSLEKKIYIDNHQTAKPDKITNYPVWSPWAVGYADKFTVGLQVPVVIVEGGKMRFHLTIDFLSPVDLITKLKIEIIEKDPINTVLYTEEVQFSKISLIGEVYNNFHFTDFGPTEIDSREEIFAKVTVYKSNFFYDSQITGETNPTILKDDEYEAQFGQNNNTIATAYAWFGTPSSPGITLEPPIIMSDGVDYYKFSVVNPSKKIIITLNDFFHEAGDFNLSLHDYNGNILFSSNSFSNEEIIEEKLNAGTYYIKVNSRDGGKGFYDLHINIPEKPTLKKPDNGMPITTQPITFDWNDVYHINNYEFEIADNISFIDGTNISRTPSEITPTGDLPPGTYYWKVRSIYSWGESDWSDIWKFIVPEAPYIHITSPTSNSNWQVGTRQSITWQDNIDENVKIEIYKGATIVGDVETTLSDGEREWNIPLGTPAGNDYKIKILSTLNSSIADISDAFTISSKPKVEVTPSNKVVSSVAGKTSFFVDANLNWSVTENEPWITDISPNSGTVPNAFMVTYEKNTSTVQRIGKITVHGGGINVPVTITQAPFIPNVLDVSESKVVSASSTSTTFDIISNVSWTTSETFSWITSISPPSGSNDGTITVKYLTNSTDQPRDGTIRIDGGGITRIRTITQAAQSVYITKIRITGSEEVNENSNIPYSCFADYSNNTSYPIPSSEITWSLNSTLYASISSTGILTTKSVSTDQNVTISTNWNNYSQSRTIKIKNVIEKPKPPKTPSPPHWAIDVPINVQLTWENGGGADYYTVMFEGVILGEQTSTSFDPGILEHGKLYTWAILAHNSIGKSTTTFWKFTTIKASQTKTQTIPLNSGWNLISLNIHPDNTSIETVFNSISSTLEEVRSLTKSYNPSVPSGFNTLKEIVDGEGYWLKVSENSTLSIEGVPIDNTNTTIPINNSWNLIGYICQKDNSIELALEQIMGDVLEVKDMTTSYNPNVLPMFNTLTIMSPNKGYWINSSANTNLIYPTPANNLTKTFYDITMTENNTEWEPIIYTNSMTFYGIFNPEISDLSINDKIGAFANSECRGIGIIKEINNEKFVTIVIQGDSSAQISFKGFNQKNNSISQLYSDFNFEPGQIQLEPTLLTKNDKSKLEVSNIPNRTTLLNSYPNPFNNSAQINFALHKPSRVKIDIYSISGEHIKNITDSYFESGNFNTTWSGTNSSGTICNSGIYLVSFKSDFSHDSHKIILMK